MAMGKGAKACRAGSLVEVSPKQGPISDADWACKWFIGLR